MRFQVSFLFAAVAGDVRDPARAPVQPALADLPGKAHGVLIAPQWVVACAHSVAARPPAHVTIAGARRPVDAVVVHPGYRQLPKTMVDAAMASGDAAPVMAFLAAADDIALLRLRSPVAQVVPAALYLGNNEREETILLLGRDTGAGAAAGMPADARHMVLRQAREVVTGVDDRWMVYRFDRPSRALPFDELPHGAHPATGGGGVWQLAGLAAWRQVQGDMRKPGRYGDNGVSVRISRYVQWLRDVMATH